MDNEEIKCWGCKDKGIVIMRETKIFNHNKEKLVYDYTLYCSCCGNGNKKYYNGKRNEKNKSDYYTPSISSVVDIDKLKSHNKINYENKTGYIYYKYAFESDIYRFEREFII